MNIKKIIVLVIALNYSSNSFSVGKITAALTIFGFVYGTYAFADNIHRKNGTLPISPVELLNKSQVEIWTPYVNRAKYCYAKAKYFGSCFKNETAIKNGAYYAVLLGVMGIMTDITVDNLLQQYSS